MASNVARAIAIRNAVKARAAANENGAEAPKAIRAKGPDLERIISGEASRSTMKRFVTSMADVDGDLMTVDQSRALEAAEQALAPKIQDRTPFQAKIEFESVEAKTSAKGDPYYVMRGVPIETADGGFVTRTVMAFGSAHARINDLMAAHQELIVDVAFAGPVLKVVEDDAPVAQAA